MYSFRPFKKSDAQTVISWVNSEEEYYKWSTGRFGEYPATPEAMLSFYEKMEEDDARAFWMVACEDARPFGFMQFLYPTDGNDTVRFGLVLVDSALRSQGYGKTILKMAIDYAFSMLNVTKITLGIFENNSNAYRLYLSVGFSDTKQSGTRKIKDADWVCNELVLYSPDIVENPDEEAVLEEQKIGKIIKNNEFLYAFQPIVLAATGEIYGYEALMRAESEGTKVSPAAVLGYAAKYGKLYDIEKATLFNVMDRYESCYEEFKDRKIFINSIPGYQLTDKDYTSFKNRYRDEFDKVLIEITEMADLNDEELNKILVRSAEAGFGLAIDDYGTGYSNTASLLRYLPNCVKLDRLLITNINEDTKKQHFVKGMVEFAHANGFKVLAEGVETSAELRTVIEIGVDLIQGFYTARPSFEIIDGIEDDIRNEIVSMNHKSQTVDTRKIYVVSEETELPLMRLSLEDYTGMLIDVPEFTLVGNTKYCAEMSIKIKDGRKCKMTIRDVFLEGFMQLPCIELGKKAELTLVIEGENKFRRSGIFVPKDTKLILEGDGNLTLRSQGIKSYGIGSDYDSSFGEITWNGTGSLDILVEADEGIGIGGGKATEESGITIGSGTVRIEPACAQSVAIGCVHDVVPINIGSANVHLDMKTDQGIGIGCGGDTQNTFISNSKLNIICAGSLLCAIGNSRAVETAGNIWIKKSDISVLANGQRMFLLGSQLGPINIDIKYATINLRGEGSEVVAIGSSDEQAIITSNHTSFNLKVSSGIPKAFGAKSENVNCIGGVQRLSINE